MKKITLLISLLISTFSFSQYTVSQSPNFDLMAFQTKQSIFALNDVSPRMVLQRISSSQAASTRGIFSQNIFWDHSINRWKRISNSTYNDFGMMRFENGSNIGFFIGTRSTSSPQFTNTQMESKRVMTLTSSRRVGIGTANPDEKLTVNGKIHAKEVRVDLNIPADYVFQKYFTGTSDLKPDYVMPTLLEVERFTKENNHLPGVPSAEEIKEEGLHLKEMTNLLLQKIEELTLYTIEQEKRINNLEKKLK